MVLRCFTWLTLSYHEIGSGAGIKKSTSRITNHLVRMAWFTSWRICISCYTHTKQRGTAKIYQCLVGHCIHHFVDDDQEESHDQGDDC
jgi:hypothetical protein